MPTSYLTKTFGSSGNRDKWTLSMWVKRAGIGTNNSLYGVTAGSDNERISFRSDNDIDWENWQSSASKGKLLTNRLFRDPAAWYHLVFVYDSANVTAGDRMKMYVNGVEEGSTGGYATDTNPTSGQDSLINNDYQQQIGANGSGDNDFDGCMTHIHFCDGYAYAASDFGSFDSTSGIWKINTGPSVSYGTNGYFILNNSASVTDDSPNSNNWTVYEYVLSTVDNPSDNFCTWNKLGPQAYPWYFYNGNTMAQTASDSTWRSVFGTLGNSTGKYYFECECDDDGGAASVGILATEQQLAANTLFGNQTLGYGYMNGGEKRNNSTGTSYGDTYTDGDIIGIAYDATNGTIWFSKNGTWQNSATIGEIAAGTTTNAAFSGITTGASKFYAPALSGYTSAKWKANFGNGYFGTTAISSEGTNASGIGKFEYDVPTGFTAWSTKGFNE